ncbi:MAG: TlpA family protein disulfide reductase [Bacteroidales bacterium]|jgi:thiol-disulfide isomerase/thioredoxin|nr:TlpA family protein disulfide reductase [Bacteroidales bacterium]
MKKVILSIITAILFASICFGQTSDAISIVSGKWERRGGAEVSLFKVISGRLEKLNTCYLQSDKQFSFAFSQTEEGYYVIGLGSPMSRAAKYAFYFKPGDRLNLVVNDTNYVLVGENTKENKEMEAYHNFVEPLERMSFYMGIQTYVDFFPLLDEKLEQPYQAQPTGNAAFDASFAKWQKFDLMHCCVHFVASPRSAHPEGEDFADYYRALKFDELTANADVLVYPYRFLQNVTYLEGRFAEDPSLIDRRSMVDRAADSTVKAELFLISLENVKDYTKLEELKATYGSLIKTDDQKHRLDQQTERILEAHLKDGIGKPAPNFTYNDVNGKKVSLSDFKGKIVYIDVWATWCGPCRKEIPALKVLEEKFHGNNDIAFIGVSIDPIKDIQKWKAFVAKEQLPGVQIHGRTDGVDDMAKLFDIGAIPRFLLIDKQGNIITVNAPAPSAEELVQMLTKLLR